MSDEYRNYRDEATRDLYMCLKIRDERDRYREALARLVALKDGPRDEDYERCKPLAWEQARNALELNKS